MSNLPSRGEKLAAIHALIQRYRSLARHGGQFSDRLAELKKVQLIEFTDCHAADSARPEYETLYRYYTDNLHSGIELEELLGESERILSIVSRLDETFFLLKNVLEFSVGTQELDDGIVITTESASPEALLASMKQSTQLSERTALAQLLRPLGPGLAPYARSRIARAAFKLGTAPLRATAIAPLVEVLANGFDALSAQDNVPQTFDKLVDNNLVATKRLF